MLTRTLSPLRLLALGLVLALLSGSLGPSRAGPRPVLNHLP
jgi:hypothetical protein